MNARDRSDIPSTPGSRRPVAADDRSDPAEVSAFLEAARRTAPAHRDRRGKLVFALDATMSRQPTWDRALTFQAEMFEEAARIGGLDVQLVYFRGAGECRASRWVGDARELAELMRRIDCRGGATQIERVLTHVLARSREFCVDALVYVGDAMEEAPDTLYARAGELGLRNVPVFLFQEGRHPAATRAFAEIARLTRGAHVRLGPGAGDELRRLLRAVAAYAAGGTAALIALESRGDAGARQLLGRLPRP